jgi:hypothetical protein
MSTSETSMHSSTTRPSSLLVNAIAVVIAVIAVGAVGAASPARAADWAMLSGTEEGRPDGIAPWGFAQLLLESQPWSTPVTGLQAPPLQKFNGSLVAAELPESFDLSVRRARLGLRGSVPGTDQRLVFIAAVEAGENGLTRDRGMVLVDASVTASVFPGLRLRVGQFKLPTADEAMENNPSAASFTRFSPFVSALLIEQDVVEGAIVGPALSLRDVGIEAFDALPLWQGEQGALDLGFAAMASLGRPSHAFDSIDDVNAQLVHVVSSGPDLTGRLQLSWLLDPKQRHRGNRDEVSVWLWRQQGARLVPGLDDPTTTSAVARVRQGAGGQVRLAGVRVRAEVAAAEGAVLAQGAFVGQPAVVLPDGVAHGGSLDVSMARLGSLALDPFTIDVGADWLARNPDDPAASRFLQSVTVGTQLTFNKTFRLLLNAELRRLEVGAEAPPDAALIASGLSPVLSTQLNLVF